MRGAVVAIALFLGTAMCVSPAAALPTMIRLGYADCAACHISPQGGGPLNEYGRGIDQAQSLQGGEYAPSTSPWARRFTFGGRVTQDLRTVLQRTDTFTEGLSLVSQFRPRLMYRNVTTLGEGFRVSGVVQLESAHAVRPGRTYDPIAQPASAFVNTALLHYRAGETLEFAAGRDQLPSGVNVPDLALFVRSRNRLGFYDAPYQAKVFWNAKRVHATPFAYRDSGNEKQGEQEAGGGGLFEVDVLGKQKTVVGLTTLKGSAANGSRELLGVYTRLGFGSWGVLAEYDVTSRHRDDAQPLSFRQSASYGQVFWAIREWLVAAATGERLRVQRPFEERLTAGKLELNARLASRATIGLSARLQKDNLTGRYSRSIAVQGAFKTVQ